MTTIPQTLLDYAAVMPFEEVRYALAEADYHRLIDLEAVREIVGRGKGGAGNLRKALAVHWPDLARTRSKLERDFLLLCEVGGLPRPKVDFFWPEQRVVVELDGAQGHSTERQTSRDHSRDLTLRRAGIAVRRYGARQVSVDGQLVLADLRSIV